MKDARMNAACQQQGLANAQIIISIVHIKWTFNYAYGGRHRERDKIWISKKLSEMSSTLAGVCSPLFSSFFPAVHFNFVLETAKFEEDFLCDFSICLGASKLELCAFVLHDIQSAEVAPGLGDLCARQYRTTQQIRMHGIWYTTVFCWREFSSSAKLLAYSCCWKCEPHLVSSALCFVADAWISQTAKSLRPNRYRCTPDPRLVSIWRCHIFGWKKKMISERTMCKLKKPHAPNWMVSCDGTFFISFEAR